jgi:hypothetical protein
MRNSKPCFFFLKSPALVICELALKPGDRLSGNIRDSSPLPEPLWDEEVREVILLTVPLSKTPKFFVFHVEKSIAEH